MGPVEPEGIRIGDLAEIAGVSTRAIRHYHRIGLLPEPARDANGYRRYGQTDAVRLLRIRQLVELGMSLDEVADAVRGDGGSDLSEMLVELDSALAARADAIAARRRRIARVLGSGGPAAVPVGPPEVAELISEWRGAAAGHPGAEREEAVIELLAGVAGPAATDFVDAYRRVLADPAVLEPALDAYRRFEELGDCDPDDPAVDRLAEEICALLPTLTAATGTPVVAPGEPDPGALAAVGAIEADLNAAQRRILEKILTALGTER